MPAMLQLQRILGPRGGGMLLSATTVLACVALLVLSGHGLPLLTGDAIAYTPPGVFWASTGRLENPLWSNAWLYDPDARFIYYPPLYPAALAATLPFTAAWGPPHVAVAVVSCLALLSQAL